MSIQIRNINKHFGHFHALHDIDLDIGAGELLALLGPSGCGKTTLLRIIAGLESADSGTVSLNGQDATHVHVRQRHVGFVFQHYALFRHLTVFENIAFGLRVMPRRQRPREAHIRAKVNELLQRVQLDGVAQRFPAQLSGGQRQRVALARALAVDPQVLLLDEPFGALDAQVRKELRRWLRRLHDELHVTSVFVTHDQEEALEVADRVVLMNGGRIEQSGAPQQVWENPATPFVYGFLGEVNCLSGRAHQGQLLLDGLSLPAPQYAHADHAPAVAYVRPYELDVQPARSGSDVPGLLARVERSWVIGPVARLELMPVDIDPQRGHDPVIQAQIPARQFAELGLREQALVRVQPRHARVFLQTEMV